MMNACAGYELGTVCDGVETLWQPARQAKGNEDGCSNISEPSPPISSFLHGKASWTLSSPAKPHPFRIAAVPCPTLTYGPNVTSPFDLIVHKGPVLIAISLPCSPAQLQRAVAIGRLFGVRVEVLHVANHVKPSIIRDLERQCEQLTGHLRSEGMHAQWSLYCGVPDTVIRSRSIEIDSPFILIPLKRAHCLSSIASDNVAAHVIRHSKIPVMTYRVD
jgi:hypothetical protein